MDDPKIELLSILKDISVSSFFTVQEKKEVMRLVTKGSRNIEELITLLRKYLVARTALGLKEEVTS